MRKHTILFIFSLLALCFGCAPRLNAVVQAVTEQGYTPKGDSYQLSLHPTMPHSEDAHLAEVRERIISSLHSLGYVAATAQPDVAIRAYWYSTGPYPVYGAVWVDDGIGRFRRMRRVMVVTEEVYHRFLVLEALKPPPKDNAEGVFQTVSDAVHMLPVPPSRIVWRVIVESRGTLAKAHRALPELVTAALPLLGRAGHVRVKVSGEEIVSTEVIGLFDANSF